MSALWVFWFHASSCYGEVITVSDVNRVTKGFDLVDNVYATMKPRRGGHFIKADYSFAYDLAYQHEVDVLAAAGSISTYRQRRLS